MTYIKRIKTSIDDRHCRGETTHKQNKLWQFIANIMIYIKNYETERATLLIYIQDNCKNFEHLSPNNKLIWLLSSEDTLLLNKLAVFLNKSFEIRRTIHCKFNLT
jgi:hypothetical protein